MGNEKRERLLIRSGFPLASLLGLVFLGLAIAFAMTGPPGFWTPSYRLMQLGLGLFGLLVLLFRKGVEVDRQERFVRSWYGLFFPMFFGRPLYLSSDDVEVTISQVTFENRNNMGVSFQESAFQIWVNSRRVLTYRGERRARKEAERIGHFLNAPVREGSPSHQRRLS